ncbi:MAG: C25 family cysteine peptidase [Blastocatellia bacterium]
MSKPQLVHPCLRAWTKRALALQAILLTFLMTFSPAQGQTCATAGKDGSGGSLTGIINTYYPGTVSANAGVTSITLGTARGATTPISSGDMLLVIQMQDAAIDSSNNNKYGDGNGGNTGGGYSAANNVGKYEFVKATSAVPLTGGSVSIQGTGTGSGLLNAYTNADYVAGTSGQRRFQVVRVPQYTSAATSGGLTAAAWNGTTGGILAFDVKDTLNLSGTASVDGLGFRGGAGLQLQGAGGANTDYRNTAPTAAQLTAKTGFHGSKGEGIAGTPRYVWNSATSAIVDTGVEGYPNGSMGRGAPGNAGGGGTDADPSAANPGGNDQNSGGGGGANGGSGGRGGNSWSANTVVGGIGGIALTAIIGPGRIVMGGGGGAGTRNNDDNLTAAASAAAGGGIVIIRARKIFGSGTISANGANAYSGTLNDGAGGGGAGGSIVVFALSSTLTSLNISANGGSGGDAWRTQAANGTPGERHGPGGGGGGGVIFTPSAPASRTVNGGANGVTTTSVEAYNSTAGSLGTTAINLTSGQIPGVASGAECSSPTAIDLINFAASTDPRGNVLLEWKTGYEVSNLGFNLYRDVGGKRTRLNNSLIGGTALLAGARTPFTAGFSYAWMDQLASPKDLATYWLEDVDVNGKTTMRDPISAMSVYSLPPQSQSLMLSQLRSNAPGATKETVSVVTSATRGKVGRVSSQSLQTQWDIASKPGAKLLINKSGWYRISQPELVAAGFDVSKDPRFYQLFVDGSELPLLINGGQSGRLDPADSIEFYAAAVDSPSTNLRAFYLTNGQQPGRRLSQLPFSEGKPSSRASFTASVERRDHFLYLPSLNNGDAENWFGALISATPYAHTLTLANLDPDAKEAATLEVALQGLGTASPPQPHLIRVQVNGQEVGTVSFAGPTHQVAQFSLSAGLLQEGANSVTLTATGGSGDYGAVDWLRLSYGHRFQADQNALLLVARQDEQVQVSGFTTAVVRVMDVTDETNPVELGAKVELVNRSYRVTATVADVGERVLLVVGDRAYQQAQVVPQVASSWHVASQGADVVMVTTASLRGALEPLVGLRKQQGYAVAVVDVEDVYDEFSYGQKKAEAIQELVAATRSWKRVPKWMVLVGDASYDPKNYLGLGENDLVPTKVVWTNTFETASDDWLGDVNGDGVSEVAIGRLPVRSVAQAQALVNKIIGYEQSAQTQGALLVADLPGEYDFEAASNSIEQLLPAGTRVQKVYRSLMDNQTAAQAIIEAVNRGPKLVNYAGHGSPTVWRGNLLTSDSIVQMSNGQALPVVISMTCLNGLFNDPYQANLGEALLLSEQGGAIAVWASSAQTVAGAQELVDQEVVRQLFSGTQAKSGALTIGEAVQRAKAVARNEAVIQSWILLGDPMITLH